MSFVTAAALAVTLAAQAPAAAPSPASQALSRGDLAAASTLPARDDAERATIDARVALATFRPADAERALARLPEGRARAELAWETAHATNDMGALAQASLRYCAMGDPTGRACADAELLATHRTPVTFTMSRPAKTGLATLAPIPLLLAETSAGQTGMFVDTGASQSVVSTDLARRLGLATTQAAFPVGVAGGGGVAMARLAVLPWVKVDSLTVRDVPVLVMDLPDLDRNGISAILSPQQVFDGLTVQIDYAKHVLDVFQGQPATPPPSHASTSLPYMRVGFDIAVAARVGRGAPALFGLDTGMAGSYVVAQPTPPAAPALSMVALQGAGGSAAATPIAPEPVQVGALTLAPSAPAHAVRLANAEIPLAGFIGNGLWSRGVVTLDTVAHRVAIALPARESADAP